MYIKLKIKIIVNFQKQNKKQTKIKYICIEQIYAMKVYKKKLLKKQNLIVKSLAERNILQKASSPFIVSLFYTFQTKHNLYLITEYVIEGDLYKHLQLFSKFDENTVAQVVLALEYLHQQNILYKDLKLENILLESNSYIKLTDFSLFKDNIKESDQTYTICGSPEYMSPEQILQKGHNKICDFWQLVINLIFFFYLLYSQGVLIYEMLCGKTPFWNIEQIFNKYQIYIDILKGKYNFPNFLSNNAKNLIYFLLQTDVNKRLGSKGFEEIKNHSFFKNIDWEKLFKKEIKSPYIPPNKNPLELQNFNIVVFFFLITKYQFFLLLQLRYIEIIQNFKYMIYLVQIQMMMNFLKNFLIKIIELIQIYEILIKKIQIQQNIYNQKVYFIIKIFLQFIYFIQIIIYNHIFFYFFLQSNSISCNFFIFLCFYTQIFTQTSLNLSQIIQFIIIFRIFFFRTIIYFTTYKNAN
ncbi:hypothetical protein IMG5_173660 [Ichthyophthirius multifiliis]|uniref:Protein kinase domain protein n=1 Tax=Ichthyophthirius multifiliis TaxID=5932 RepID=G0R1Y5_ICHMU|nr:hypothetical protein IMG5_173660 [Ichthyophthirius multifiliis]EGR28510.1 hypothetical protein IMG5_173660 [Ichthyophthirius multifiliis]|eukprot:XP_004029746.1 hypothetical protein IMG5_173660 [Ichthyophthirius multifiliis]